MRTSYLLLILVASGIFAGCSGGGGSSLPPPTPQGKTYVGDHVKIPIKALLDLSSSKITLAADKSVQGMLNFDELIKSCPDTLTATVKEIDQQKKTVKVAFAFKNPYKISLGNVRAAWHPDGNLVPKTNDGWTIRDGGASDNPDKYFEFGTEYTSQKIESGKAASRDIIFQYKAGSDDISATFILDGTVGANTGEPHAFANATLTGRFFHIQILDYQDDVSSVTLNTLAAGMPVKIKLAPFGNQNEWGASLPDLNYGTYNLILTADSTEESLAYKTTVPVTAVTKVPLSWPPVGKLEPMPTGQGIYGYTWCDPDNSEIPPVMGCEAFTTKVEKMGGQFLLLDLAQICNDGHLSEIPYWMSSYIDNFNQAAPDMPIHLSFHKVGFTSAKDDPCGTPPEDYPQTFFDNLLDDIRTEILGSNGKASHYNLSAGLHFDIEIFPNWSKDKLPYTVEELDGIYKRYADFLARLHMEPGLDGRNITIWDFKQTPEELANPGNNVKKPELLPYLATCDAFMPSCYYMHFSCFWDPKDFDPFAALNGTTTTYKEWSEYYGRPYLPALETYGGWVSPNKDQTSQDKFVGSEICENFERAGAKYGTSNEYTVAQNVALNGLLVQSVMLKFKPRDFYKNSKYSGDDIPIYPASGLAVYRLGKGVSESDPDGTDFIYCRSAYSLAKAYQRIMQSNTNRMMMPGFTTFRYENDHDWKAAALANPLISGDITGCSGSIHFSDGAPISQHKSLWGKIAISIVDPSQAIMNNPIYRKSIDIVGIKDGTFIYPDLPRGWIYIKATAPGWESDPLRIDLNAEYAFKPDQNLVLHPK